MIRTPEASLPMKQHNRSNLGQLSNDRQQEACSTDTIEQNYMRIALLEGTEETTLKPRSHQTCQTPPLQRS